MGAAFVSIVCITPKESIVTNVSPDSLDPEISQSMHKTYVSPVSAIYIFQPVIVLKVISPLFSTLNIIFLTNN